jgi:hypothetical protein
VQLKDVLSEDLIKKYEFGSSAWAVEVEFENMIWVGWSQEYEFLTRNTWFDLLQKEDPVYNVGETRFENSYFEKNSQTLKVNPHVAIIYYDPHSNRIKRLTCVPLKNSRPETNEYTKALIENRKIAFGI